MPASQTSLIVRTLLFALLAAGIYFFHGFIVPVLAALIIGFASWPLYHRLLVRTGSRPALAASIALVVIVVALIVPFFIALHFAMIEAQYFLHWLQSANTYGSEAPRWIASLPWVGSKLAAYWNANLNQPQALAHWFELFSGEHLGNIYRTVLSTTSRLASSALSLLFMLITLFFIYKDGARIAGQIDRIGDSLLPQHWQRLSRMVPATVTATVTGMGLIALGEGVVLGIAYWIAGVPSPILLGVATGVMALIPGGAPVSFTLVSLYLVGSGHTGAGLGLFVWGSLELFVVDKTLRPRLVGGPVKLPFLPTFFGLIGGVKTLGLVGLFIGPVLMALIVAVWREWLHSIKTASVALPAAAEPLQYDALDTPPRLASDDSARQPAPPHPSSQC